MRALVPALFKARFLLLAFLLVCSTRLLSGCGDTDPAPSRPCDLFAVSTPCAAAFSTTRALYGAFSGSLYQVTRQSDGTTLDIGVTSDLYADAASQDAFCTGTTCTITKLYDQSPNHNDLTPAPPGGAARGTGPNGFDLPAVANALPVTVAGHKVYGIAISPGMGYRNDATTGIATLGEAEGVYMVTSSVNLNGRCCFDFGNAEINNKDNGAGHMDAINVICSGNPCSPEAGLDLENGIYGHLSIPSNTTFVTAMGANDGQTSFSVYGGNAQSGDLTSTNMSLPQGYQPMLQEGAIILGIGGDNSDGARGYFFEGVMTTGAPTSDVMSSVQSNIVSAAYTGQIQ